MRGFLLVPLIPHEMLLSAVDLALFSRILVRLFILCLIDELFIMKGLISLYAGEPYHWVQPGRNPREKLVKQFLGSVRSSYLSEYDVY